MIWLTKASHRKKKSKQPSEPTSKQPEAKVVEVEVLPKEQPLGLTLPRLDLPDGQVGSKPQGLRSQLALEEAWRNLKAANDPSLSDEDRLINGALAEINSMVARINSRMENLTTADIQAHARERLETYLDKVESNHELPSTKE
jgi:hypothetical protein